RCPGRSSGPAASPDPGPRPALDLVWPSRLARPGASSSPGPRLAQPPCPTLGLVQPWTSSGPAALPGPGPRPAHRLAQAGALASGTATLIGPELPVRVVPPNPQPPFRRGCAAKGSFKTEVTNRNSSNF